MTCIVGLVHQGNVYIGGDSAGVAGYSLTVRKDVKVFRNGDFLIGFTSSFRMGQLLRHSFLPPVSAKNAEQETPASLERYMTTTFVDALRTCFKDGGYAQKMSEQESGGSFLVGFQGRLFTVENDYQVGETLCGYDAIGCGDDIALGVLYATPNMEPRQRIELALHASEQHNIGVRGPFHIDVLEAV